jgi:hypothetical protein
MISPVMAVSSYYTNPEKILRKKEETVAVDACKDMWIAVLKQAIADALRPLKGEPEFRNKVQQPWEVLLVEHSRSWITNLGSDFKAVCEMAGFNPENVRDGYLRLKEEGKTIRDVTVVENEQLSHYI